MFTIKNIDYKSYLIKVWEQKPTLGHEKRNLEEEFQGLGTHGYEIFNPKGLSIFYDDQDMWDEGACYQNAIQDINIDLEKEKANA